MSVDLTGKTIIITGGNGGIGKATAVALAKMGATIVIAGRESEKTNQAIEEIKQESSNTKISNMALDLSDLQSVRNFTKEVKALDLPIDVLINNAGVNYMHYNETKDGFESNMGINHLGHFLLTMELLPLLIKNKSRVVVLSSGLYKQKRTINFNALRSKEEFSIMAYAESKLANLLFVKEFHRRYNDKGIRIYAVHPGVIRTDLARNTFLNKASFLLNYPPFSWIWKSPEEGALTSVYCASSPDLEGVSGKYYESSKEVNTNSVANNEELARKLWQVSEQMVGLNS